MLTITYFLNSRKTDRFSEANSDLVIVELSHASASVEGGTKMILLCEKVNRDDIEVLFYEEKDGEVIWQDKAKFSPTDVHRQV